MFHKPLLNAPLPSLLVAAGIIFLGVAIVGEVSGTIQPGKKGRIAGGVVGSILIITGLVMAGGGNGGEPTPIVTDTPPPKTPTATPQPDTPTATSQPEEFRVIEVFVRADPFDYTGDCPVKIRFSARISVLGGSGKVTYRWIRSDGANAPIRTLEFTESGSKDIESTWTLGGPNLSEYSGWKAIRILEPNNMTSDQAEFEIHCG